MHQFGPENSVSRGDTSLFISSQNLGIAVPTHAPERTTSTTRYRHIRYKFRLVVSPSLDYDSSGKTSEMGRQFVISGVEKRRSVATL